MIAEWASIYIIYDASITLFEKAWTWHEVPVPNHLMETESEFAPWDLSKAHILVSTPALPNTSNAKVWSVSQAQAFSAFNSAKETLFIDLWLWTVWEHGNCWACMSAISLVLVIDMNWINARTPHQLARLARHWTSTGAYTYSSGTAKLVQCSAHSCPELIWNRQHDSRLFAYASAFSKFFVGRSCTWSLMVNLPPRLCLGDKNGISN